MSRSLALLVLAALARAGDALPDAACLAYAREVEAAVRAGDRARLGALLDTDRLLERAAPVWSGDLAAYATGYRLAAKRDFLEGGGFFGGVARAVTEGGTYAFLRLAERDGRRCARFRLVGANQGANYHDLLLVADENRVRADDVFVFAAAETLSATMRRNYLQSLADGAPELVGALPDEERARVAWIPTVAKMAAALGTGQHGEVLRLHATLPEAAMREKAVLVLRLKASGGDTEAHRAALDALRGVYPEDASVDLLAIDGLHAAGAYGEAAEALTRLTRAVGGDPYLDALRARALLEAGRHDAARTAAHAAVKGGVETRLVYLVLLRVELATRRFGEVPPLLRTLEERFGVEFGDLTTRPIFAEFVESDAYADWRGGD